MERLFAHNLVGLIFLLVEIFSLSVFIILKYQQAQPHMMTHRLNINQLFVQAEVIYGCLATGICHTTLQAVCFSPFKPVGKITARF